MRVAGPHQTPWEEGTSIKNVSLTGLAFTAPEDLCPLLGEVIKIQFIPPGAKQMACYAIVTRLENISEQRMLVGVHFYKLEMPHRITLAQSLARKFKETQDRGEIDNLLNKDPNRISLLNFPQIFMMMVLGTLWCGAIYSLFKLQYEGLFIYLRSLF
ncbi:PilZ domain protein [compost metagenome]